jgi:hypothetical protein
MGAMMAGRWRDSGRLRTVAGTVAAIAAGLLLAPLAGLAGCTNSATPGTGSHDGNSGATSSSRAGAAPTVGAVLQQQYEDVIKSVLPSVVQINTDTATGSGVVYDGKGDIVTNAHVIGNASTVQVLSVTGGATLSAKVLGVYRPDDLAVIRVTAGAGTLRAAPFGPSADIQAGMIVMVMGNPLGVSGRTTVTSNGEPAGVAIVLVTPGGPAAKAGLRAGDLITELDGEQTLSLSELGAVLAGLNPGASVRDLHPLGRRAHRAGHTRQPARLAPADVLAPDLRIALLKLLHRRDAARVVKQQDLDALGPQEVQVPLERPCFADHDARNLEEQDRAGAHLARGERGVESGVQVRGATARVAQRGDLPVRHRVPVLHPFVVAGRDHRAAGGEDGTNWHAAPVQAGPRLLEGERHQFTVFRPQLVCHEPIRYPAAPPALRRDRTRPRHS